MRSIFCSLCAGPGLLNVPNPCAEQFLFSKGFSAAVLEPLEELCQTAAARKWHQNWQCQPEAGISSLLSPSSPPLNNSVCQSGGRSLLAVISRISIYFSYNGEKEVVFSEAPELLRRTKRRGLGFELLSVFEKLNLWSSRS